MSVTLYRHNRLDNAVEEDAVALALQFVEACRQGSYRRGGRMDVEFEYRWWLSGGDGMNSTWDEDDWPVMWTSLVQLLNSEPSAKETVLQACDPTE